MGKSTLGRRNSKCKGPEVEAYFTWPKNGKDVNVSGVRRGSLGAWGLCNESAPEFGNQCSKAVFPTACSMRFEYRDNGPLASMPLAMPLSTLLLVTSVNLQIFPSFTEYSWSLPHPNPVIPQSYFGGSVGGPHYLWVESFPKCVLSVMGGFKGCWDEESGWDLWTNKFGDWRIS